MDGLGKALKQAALDYFKILPQNLLLGTENKDEKSL
jgi:hypothetical protein